MRHLIYIVRMNTCRCPACAPTQIRHQQHEDYFLTTEGLARQHLVQNHLLNVLTTDASDDKLNCDSNGALMKTEKAFL